MDEKVLREWWMAKAAHDADIVVPKAAEYSSSDLLAIGASVVPWLDDKRRIEAAIAFYANGKTARILGSLNEGRTPNIDSWDDLGVYSFMGRFVREFGYWGLGVKKHVESESLNIPRCAICAFVRKYCICTHPIYVMGWDGQSSPTEQNMLDALGSFSEITAFGMKLRKCFSCAMRPIVMKSSSTRVVCEPCLAVSESRTA